MSGSIAECAEVLGTLFLVDPSKPEGERLVATLMGGSADLWPFGDTERVNAAFALIGQTYEDRGDALHRQYCDLFVGPAHFEAPAWGSVYLDRDNIVFGRSTLELRAWMRRNGIEVLSNEREPEDHIGKMLLLLAWIARNDEDLIDEFLAEHLMTWAPRYLDLLEKAGVHPFYRALCTLTRETLEDIVSSRGIRPRRAQLFL